MFNVSLNYKNLPKKINVEKCLNSMKTRKYFHIFFLSVIFLDILCRK
jgi:hypothetical protein